MENEQIRVGFSLAKGGALGWISQKKPGSTSATEENLVNIHDPGRWVQGAFYSGPVPFGKPHPGWPQWPWNPVQAGDAYGFVSKLLEQQRMGNTFYTRTIPLQWALRNEPAEAVLESWTTLVGNQLILKQRLSTNRSEKELFPGRDQELPALYGIGKLSRFVYGPDANQPGGAVQQFVAGPLKPPPPQWKTVRSAEGWAALVDEKGNGLGLIHPGGVRFLGGHYGKPGTGGSLDDSTGYIAAVRRETIDCTGSLEYESRIVAGSLEQIRAEARKLVPQNPWQWRPGKTRDHGNPEGIIDTPLETRGRKLICLNRDPQWVISDLAIPALDFQKVVIKARYFPPQGIKSPPEWKTMLMFESSPPSKGPGENQVFVSIKPDGEWHELVFRVKAQSAWKGVIQTLRWDPLEDAEKGTRIDVETIEVVK